MLREGYRGRVLADDSGLEIDALGGGPGIYSARYGGPEMSWPERRAALLADFAACPHIAVRRDSSASWC